MIHSRETGSLQMEHLISKTRWYRFSIVESLKD